ncbi:hypothetical protein HDU98_003859, partial [Podochytrium sp. JEL0797]
MIHALLAFSFLLDCCLAGTFSTPDGTIAFSGTLLNPATAQICVHATATPQKSYTAIGIPAKPLFPRMANADFYLFTTLTNSTVQLRYGISTDLIATTSKLTSASYNTSTNTLDACFTRPVAAGVEGDRNALVVNAASG